MTSKARSVRIAVALVAVLVVALVVGAGPAGASSRTAPKLKDPAVTARALVTEYLTILQREDTAALAKFLAPAFQLQRADGTGADKREYLADPATVTAFTIAETLTARQDGDVLTVRWGVGVDSVINGAVQASGTAPRLSTFVWRDGRWRLVSHGNFNRPA